MTNLDSRHLSELHELAAKAGVPRFRTLRRRQLVEALGNAGEAVAPEELEPRRGEDDRDDRSWPRTPAAAEPCAGVLDVVPEGFGFLRVEGLTRSEHDVYVSRSQVRGFGLRSGDEVAGRAREPRRSDRYRSLAEVETVDGRPAAELDRERRRFGELAAVPARERLALATGGADLGVRMAELVAPIGKGQRCVIAGAPGAGATRLLMQVAAAVVRRAEVVPFVVVVDARPEEVDAWRDEVGASVYAASSDRSPETQVRLAQLALERAKRIVEHGQDAVVVLDSITRLARAHSVLRPRARHAELDEQQLESGLEAAAVRFAKRWFSVARNTDGGAALTIVTAARISSDSPLDELVYGGVSDTASAELRLDRSLAAGGRFPALDVSSSYSRDEESLLGARAENSRALRRELAGLDPARAWELLAERLTATRTNDELLDSYTLSR